MDLIHYLDLLDRDLLIWLNQAHSPFWDTFMTIITGKWIWVPFYVLIAVFIYLNNKKSWWLILLAIGCTIACADMFASSFLKPYVERLRPCHVLQLQEMLNMPGGCGGKYGFISSHASNTFGLATFLFLLFRDKYSWISLIFVWALIVSYSRIYLAVHYPGDILAGMVAGSFWAVLFFNIYKTTEKRFLIKAD